MPIAPRLSFPDLPDSLVGLRELALDLQWSWNHATDALWERIHPAMWKATHQPWRLLQTVTESRLAELAADAEFCKLVTRHVRAHRASFERNTAFQEHYPKKAFSIAYFSMEYGLTPALPLYRDEFSLLTGDFIKAAHDWGIPLTAIGLLYQRGDVRQWLNRHGVPIEYYPVNEPSQLPLTPVRHGEDEWLHVKLDFPGWTTIWLRVWKAQLGRITLYLLDSQSPLNPPALRGILSEPYGHSPEVRLQQEIILGIGGWQLLEMLNLSPTICHLHESHAAWVILARAQSVMRTQQVSFEVALTAIRPGNTLTTHTCAEGGFDQFAPSLISDYFASYAQQIGWEMTQLLALGRHNPNNPDEPFNTMYLAVHGSGTVHSLGIAHAARTQTLLQPLFWRWPPREIPVTPLTHGIHVPSWDSEAADQLWSRACSKERWRSEGAVPLEGIAKLTDKTLWNFRSKGRQQLIEQLQTLDRALPPPSFHPEALTIGMACRFTSHQRPDLLLHEPQRLIRLLTDEARPVQLVIAGKAHPYDDMGPRLVAQWTAFARRPDVQGRVVFLMDDDLDLTEWLAHGVDLWLTTARRWREPSSTTGLRVVVNGGLNVSTLTDWWADAYQPEVGWAISVEPPLHDTAAQDRSEANHLYSLLEEHIIPLFYERDPKGIPSGWVAKMRTSMTTLPARYNAYRTVKEWVERVYWPAAQQVAHRTHGSCEAAVHIAAWRAQLAAHWSDVQFIAVESHVEDDQLLFNVTVQLGKLAPDGVAVQLYAEPQSPAVTAEIHPMTWQSSGIAEEAGTYHYTAALITSRPAHHYTPRVIAAWPDVSIPLEAPFIHWA